MYVFDFIFIVSSKKYQGVLDWEGKILVLDHKYVESYDLEHI